MAISMEELMRAFGRPMNPNVQQVGPVPGAGVNVPMSQPVRAPVAAPMPAQAPAPAPERRGLLGGFFGPEGRDARARLAIALEGMTLNPNEALIGELQRGIEGRETERQQNKTLEWLASLGTPQAQRALQYAEATGDVIGATKIALEPAPQVEQTALMQNVQWLMSQGIPMERALEMARGGTTVHVGGEGPQPELVGTSGLVAIPDPSQPSGFRTEVLPGSQLALEREKAAREQEKIETSAEKASEGRVRAADVVIEDIGRFRNLVETAPWYDPATGFGATRLSEIGGTTAANAAQLSQTIRANIGFDRLQQMREESPTGGALGQVAVQELEALQSVLGSLSQAQDRGQLVYNLDRLEEIYQEIIRKASAYPNAEKYGFAPQQEQISDDELLRMYGGQ